jgi:hypothetical protein
MSKLVQFAQFLWDFVVGDDWRIALAVVAGLAVTGLVSGTGFAAWVILPLCVAAILTVSVFAVARKR